MTKNSLLIEILAEEFPYKYLKNLSKNFYLNFKEEMNLLKFKYKNIKLFATSRRIALQIFFDKNILIKMKIEKRGPKLSQSFLPNGNPTKIALCWAKKNSININNINIISIKKTKWIIYKKTYFKSIDFFIEKIIINSIKKLNKYKMMKWGDKNITFVRPINNIVIMINNKLIKKRILGIKSSQTTLGNHFMKNKKIFIDHTNNYSKILLIKGMVIADYKTRKKIIYNKIVKKLKEINGKIKVNNKLLDDITSLVEWPNAIIASFKKSFLKIPNEILKEIITFHRKYIPVYYNETKLLPYFIFVINIKLNNIKTIISGHEKVLNSFLSDAKYFFEKDRKKRLEEYRLILKKIIFKKNLGNLLDKSNRIQILSCFIAKKIGCNINKVSRAAFLSKCDLATKMVFEFPNLSGIIGMYYAKLDKESDDVSLALKEQYYPNSYNYILPTTLISCTISIADKIDTLVGIFEKENLFKKENDPLGLKKISKDIIYILLEKNISINLKYLIEKSISIYNKNSCKNLKNNIIKFIIKRIKCFLIEKKYRIDIIESVLSNHKMNYVHLYNQINFLEKLIKFKKISNFLFIYKRIKNFLLKNKNNLKEKFFLKKLKEKLEIKLYKKINDMTYKININLKKGNYKKIFIILSETFDLINSFLEKNIIMHKDIEIKNNRLLLLKKLEKLFLKICNISLLKYKN